MRCWIRPYSGIPSSDFSASLWQLLQKTPFVGPDWHCVYRPLFWRSAWHKFGLNSPLNGSDIDGFFGFSFLSFISFGFCETDIPPTSRRASSALNPYFSAHIFIAFDDTSSPKFFIILIMFSEIIMFIILLLHYVLFILSYIFFSIFSSTFVKVEPNLPFKSNKFSKFTK